MAEENEKTFIDYLKKVSPGTALRTVIDDLLLANLGALIVVYTTGLDEIMEGGFKVNCKLTTPKLFELCKMDGAIIVSQDLSRILYANVLLTPENAIYSNETGTRHKAAERTAKQAETFIIAVSERKNKTTLYFKKTRYYPKSSNDLLIGISSSLQILEKQKEIFNELMIKLNILEMSELVSVSDVCRVLQRIEMITRISESIKRELTELGREGSIMNMRHKELLKGVEKSEEDIIRDYGVLSIKRTKALLDNLSFEGLLELESIARLVLEKNIEDTTSPRGYRFLSHLNLSGKEISQIVINIKNLNNLFKTESKNLEPIIKNRAGKIKQETDNLREQILSGKVIC